MRGIKYVGAHFFISVWYYLQVGFNMRKVSKGNVTIKLWDLGGQPRFRSMWERYCRGVSAIVYVSPFEFFNKCPVCISWPLPCFLQLALWRLLECVIMSAFEHTISEGGDLLYGSYVVDAADRDNINNSRMELHDLLNKSSLGGIPLLVLGNKIDKPEAISKPALIDQMYDVLLFRTSLLIVLLPLIICRF